MTRCFHDRRRGPRAGNPPRWSPAWPLVALWLLALGGCDGAGTAPRTTVTASTRPAATASTQAPRDRSPQVRDLSIDESMGGHTLARHVGKSDAELAERLRREPHISSASTYTDRATAERVVGATLAASSRTLDPWERRSGRRPNLALHSDGRATRPIGRSLSRGERTAASCDRAIVVLRWDERRDRFFVLTSYPEAHR